MTMSIDKKYDKYELLQNEYIEWALMDKHAKAVANLPSSDVQWAKVKGIADRTIRKWKQNPEFIAKYEKRERERTLALPGATALQTAGAINNQKAKDERNEHEAIKSKLIERAMAGDRASAELYFKTYGKAFVDEEVASRKSDFREMDIEQLYEKVLALVPVSKIEDELAKRKEVQ
jgi:hypothetical protein